MKIILLENIRKIGSIGDIIDVKRGFARNYLIVKKKALYASKQNVQQVDKIRKKNTKRYICECGLSLQLGSKQNHLKTKRHQDFLLKNQAKVANSGGKTSHLKTKKKQKYLLKLSSKMNYIGKKNFMKIKN